MPARKKEEINLLPQKGFESNTVGRLLAWVLSSFRIIVIVTEIIVMIAFLSRFWLDAQNADLTDEIGNKKAVLESYKDFEKDFRDTQKRLSVYAFITGKEELASLLKSLSDFLPPDIYLSGFSYSNGQINLVAHSTNEISIQQYLVNINTIDRVENIALTEIETEKDNPGLMKFTLSMNVKNK